MKFLFLLLLSSQAFAGDWYHSETILKVGDVYSKNPACLVKGQLMVGRGSSPMRVAMGRISCAAAFEGQLKEGETVGAILNGETDVVNCLICSSEE
jgi:hypothetical protein